MWTLFSFHNLQQQHQHLSKLLLSVGLLAVLFCIIIETTISILMICRELVSRTGLFYPSSFLCLCVLLQVRRYPCLHRPGDTMATTRPTELYYPELYYLVKHRSMLRALLKATSFAATGKCDGLHSVAACRGVLGGLGPGTGGHDLQLTLVE